MPGDPSSGRTHPKVRCRHGAKGGRKAPAPTIRKMGWPVLWFKTGAPARSAESVDPPHRPHASASALALGAFGVAFGVAPGNAPAPIGPLPCDAWRKKTSRISASDIRWL